MSPPLALKSVFTLSFCELAAGSRNNMEPVDKTVIDRSVRVVYFPYLVKPKPENVPVCFDIKELGKWRKNLGMLVIQNQIWNRVMVNRSEGKAA